MKILVLLLLLGIVFASDLETSESGTDDSSSDADLVDDSEPLESSEEEEEEGISDSEEEEDASDAYTSANVMTCSTCKEGLCSKKWKRQTCEWAIQRPLDQAKRTKETVCRNSDTCDTRGVPFQYSECANVLQRCSEAREALTRVEEGLKKCQADKRVCKRGCLAQKGRPLPEWWHARGKYWWELREKLSVNCFGA